MACGKQPKSNRDKYKAWPFLRSFGLCLPSAKETFPRKNAIRSEPRASISNSPQYNHHQSLKPDLPESLTGQHEKTSAGCFDLASFWLPFQTVPSSACFTNISLPSGNTPNLPKDSKLGRGAFPSYRKCLALPCLC